MAAFPRNPEVMGTAGGTLPQDPVLDQHDPSIGSSRAVQFLIRSVSGQLPLSYGLGRKRVGSLRTRRRARPIQSVSRRFGGASTPHRVLADPQARNLGEAAASPTLKPIGRRLWARRRWHAGGASQQPRGKPEEHCQSAGGLGNSPCREFVGGCRRLRRAATIDETFQNATWRTSVSIPAHHAADSHRETIAGSREEVRAE